MSLIRLKNVTRKYEDPVRLVLKEVFFRVAAGERVGLIGKNGTGKTTLLKLILGRDEPTEGTVELTNGVKIGYFSQFSELDSEQSAQEVLEEVFADIRSIEAELQQISDTFENQPPPPDQQEALLERQTELLEQMEHRDGWSYQNLIETALSQLSFDESRRHKPIHQLSGGWRNRAALAKILLEKPDLLLMDEPTNFLDLAGIAWLEKWFIQHAGGLVLVTHDRHFLDKVVTRIVEIENHHTHEYPVASFGDYVRQRQARLKMIENQFQHEEELLLFEAEAIADRKDAAQDPSGYLQRKLANIKKATDPKPVDAIVTGLYQNLRCSERLGALFGLTKAYGDHLLFENVSLDLLRGQRLVVVGPNGCGKSTLLRILTEDETPDAGSVEWLGGAQCVSFNDALEHLNLTDTVTHAVNTTGGEGSLAFKAPRKQVHKFLELMGFSESALQQRIGTLSGGQKARVALARCLLSGAQVLILDEPTNHLDLASIQIMERALVHFPGAVVAVSHDRFFIDKVATNLLVFEGNGQTRLIAGNWTTWQTSIVG
ncbi:MAG: ABC-F family ATP-binding cassette domain-containing protein [Phycisphaerae bacterium]